MSLIATRLGFIKPSPTLAVSAKAAELKRSGVDVISLGAGEPDFDTPENIKLAAIAAIKAGATKYTNVDGMPELKKAVCKKFKRENGLEYLPEQIIIGTGGKQVIYNLFMATLNKGDEVIIPAPYWVSYPDIVLLAEGKPVIIEAHLETGFKIMPESLDAAITDKTKWFVLNSPSNPSGAAYSKQDLLLLANILRKYPHVQIMSDDIYEHITFDRFKFYNLVAVAPDLKERIFIVNGVSKAYSMTGWRIGYGAGNKDIIKAMALIQSQSTSNPSSISQMAAIEALIGIQNYIPKNALSFEKKRDLVFSLLSRIKNLECYKPEGAFYLFIRCMKLFGKKTPSGKLLKNDNDVATYLLENGNVAVVPGIAFGLEGYFRISYATSEELLVKACQRIEMCINQLTQ
ncbi:aspartate aminotransferase [Candidatus Megaera polyxenophila]|jgi:aspartate aminotransferase|uniref:pyridoxal phosphate-dependent aminotransferase n=1 Tax=Candidatus Megaera polyxenophila TaxID=988779 RepID=UPI00249E2B75|nr:pyridoxal phosphate-dependent aminotransferase [Candidatus Megaera polyxenophila]BBB56293.1 aspartate aminotransferase [Candidatus Megaera polyxenophila]